MYLSERVLENDRSACHHIHQAGLWNSPPHQKNKGICSQISVQMSGRIPASFGSSLLLIGAFGIGWMLHQTLTVGTLSLTSPIALGAFLGGVFLVGIGYRLQVRFAPSEFVSGGTNQAEEEYDDAVSPLKEEWLESQDRDSSYDR